MGTENRKLKIELFGGFSIFYGDEICIKDTGTSKKVVNLLQYLIANRQKKISQESIIYAMKIDDGNKNPAAVLKNLIYRVRVLLKNSGLPEEDYIVQNAGAYCWNNEIPCEVDVEEFEAYCQKAETKDNDEQTKLHHYSKAVALYKGKFLPKNSVELWIIPLATYYETMFHNCMKKSYEIVRKTEDYECMVKMCLHAIEANPFEEDNYVILIESYCKLGKFKDALVAYEKVTDWLYDELGVKPSAKLIQLYEMITTHLNQVEKNLVIIGSEFKEEEDADRVFYCPYGMLKSIVQFTLRMFERTGQTLCMLLLTITDENGDLPPENRKQAAMDSLRDVINESLRRGDLFSRYSPTQYIVLLVSADYENSAMVGGRIMENYDKHFKSKHIRLSYKVKVVERE